MMVGARPVIADIDPDRLAGSAAPAAVTPRTRPSAVHCAVSQPTALMQVADRYRL
jgi:hypothetical protein